MARAGVYFSDVKEARDSLIAKGRRPSIDAVRAELGNTGSKTTIHKYLKELEEERVQGQPVSDTIQALIMQLADQLKADADLVVREMRQQMASERGQHEQENATARASLAEAQQRHVALAEELSAVRQELNAAQQRFQDERIARHIAEQRSGDLSERLVDAQRHQASLEDKYSQARDALQHFRSASKEQRDQEGRRHEHQVQSLQAQLRETQQSTAHKHEQLTQLNKEAAGLAAELGAVKQDLYSEKESGRSLSRKLEQLLAAESRAATAEAQAEASRTRATEARDALVKANALGNELRQQLARLEAQLASTCVTSIFEQRIAELQQAVFGNEAAKTTDANGTS